MENMDIEFNYGDNTELLSSEFFDTIRSVENEFQLDQFLGSPTTTDDFNVLSDSSSQLDGDGCQRSPSNYISESEKSEYNTEFTDESSSPIRSLDAIDDSFLEFFTPLPDIQPPKPSPSIIDHQISPKQQRSIAHHNNNNIINNNNGNKQTQFIIQPHTKNITVKHLMNSSQLKKIGAKQVIKVQPLTTTNGKPVILPYEFKNLKVINVNDLKTERIQVKAAIPNTAHAINKRHERVSAPDSDPEVTITELSEVKLTTEEKRLLEKEGISLPPYHPLTKLEDRELKRIRRKIRNKISAQDSRKRKKEYVDGLEERMRRGCEENKRLVRRVNELQKKNQTLTALVHRLQSLVFRTTPTNGSNNNNNSSTNNKATPSTCLMIVLLSALCISLPNIHLNGGGTNSSAAEEQIEKDAVMVGRSLLSTARSMEDDLTHTEQSHLQSPHFYKEEIAEFLKFHSDNNDSDYLYKTAAEEWGKNIENTLDLLGNSKDDGGERNEKFNDVGALEEFVKKLSALLAGVSDGRGSGGGVGGCNKSGGNNKRMFLEPDLDGLDDTPPSKRFKLHNDGNINNVEQSVFAATIKTGTEFKNK